MELSFREWEILRLDFGLSVEINYVTTLRIFFNYK